MAPSVNKLGLILAKDLCIFTALVKCERLSREVRKGSQVSRRHAMPLLRVAV